MDNITQIFGTVVGATATLVIVTDQGQQTLTLPAAALPKLERVVHHTNLERIAPRNILPLRLG